MLKIRRALIDQLLKLAKIDVELAGNGVIGYEKAKAGRPDVILMDLKMPQMDLPDHRENQR